MPNKRLKNALNAGKLIKRGFSLNKQKPQDLHLLYTVDCRNDRVEFAQDDDDEDMADIESRTKSRLFQIGSDSSDESEVADRNSNLTPSKSARIDSDVSLTDEKVEILCLQFNQNLNLLATGDSDGLVAIYDIFSGSSVRKKPNTNPQNSTLKKFFPSTKKSKKLGVAASLSNNNMPTVCLKWHPCSNFSMNFLYYANVNGYIGVMDTETLEQRVLIEEQDEIACIDFSIDGSCLASVGKDAIVKLYDSNLNSNSGTLSKLIVSYGADSSSTSATPRSLMSARNDRFDSNRRLLLLDTDDDPMNNDSISPSSHTNRLQAVKFSNTSSNILFTGGWDRSVKIWDRRTQRGYVNSLNGPFICGSDAIDVNDNQVLTASWVKENALKLWDIRNCSKSVSTLSISTQERKKTWSNDDDDDNDVSITTSKQKRGDNKGDTSTKSQSGEYLYGCKFFSSCNQSFDCDEEVVTANSPRKDSGGKSVNKLNYSTVLACGSGTQSLHLVDYEQASSGRHLAAVDCQSPLYCLDAIYSCSLIACGGMKKFFMMMSSSHDLQFQ